ncbi:hypothetical protein [Pseudomonas neuropathica]|uniref:Uncharacterized protein n=1 Tax=Pseudomonas neuropathica TaxID=2730425 RepID=A0ACC7MTM7_9PSED
MNSLAQQALVSALGKALPTPTGKASETEACTDVSSLCGPVPLPQIVITGPINRVMELEGKRYALDFVRGLGASLRREPVRTKAIADLTRYGAAHPSSVASGVKIVIDLLRGA